MKTEFGTSYNSYIVKGNNKIVLIDGCHETFAPQFVENIEEVTPISKIDYLVVNHCEPDHTGALRILLKKIPNVKILTTPSGNIFLKKIINLPLNIQVVTNNETIDLGGKTLQFLFAPFLH
jgi:flavorubredoxin